MAEDYLSLVHRRQAYLAIWLILLTASQAALLLAVYRIFVQTRTGQAVDTISLTANWIGRDELEQPVTIVLNAMSVVSLAVVTALVFFIALVRRGFRLAVVAIIIIAGANVTTQFLKYSGLRPEFGIDPERIAGGNTLPSGHTTIAASVAIALIMVLPRAVGGVGAFALTAWAAFAGVATLVAGWHRPSDAVAAFLVAGAWTSAASLLLIPTLPDPSRVVADADDTGGVASGPGWAASALLGAGAGALVLAAGMLWLTLGVIDVPVDELSRSRLLIAYAGGAAWIAGTAGLVLGLVSATVARLIPRRPPLKAPKSSASPKAPRTPRTPRTPRAPKSPKSPGTSRAPKALKS